MKKIILSSVLLILLIGIFVLAFISDTMTSNVIAVDKYDKDWLKENCECVERENFYCRTGFELRKELCVRGKDITRAYRACSRYDCDGEIYSVALEDLE